MCILPSVSVFESLDLLLELYHVRLLFGLKLDLHFSAYRFHLFSVCYLGDTTFSMIMTPMTIE